MRQEVSQYARLTRKLLGGSGGFLCGGGVALNNGGYLLNAYAYTLYLVSLFNRSIGYLGNLVSNIACVFDDLVESACGCVGDICAALNAFNGVFNK